MLPYSCHAANQLWKKGRTIGIRKSPCEQSVLRCTWEKDNYNVKGEGRDGHMLFYVIVSMSMDFSDVE